MKNLCFKRKFLAVLITFFLGISNSHSGPIAINTADISDLPNYLDDSLFTPFFDSASTTIIDFEGPWSPPDTTNSYFDQGLVGSTYNSIGVEFGVNDTFMGGQPGFGWITSNTVVGNGGSPYDGPININLVIPGTSTATTVTSIGAFVADGPTNETTAWFYDLNDVLLGSVSASANLMFLGWSDTAGIASMKFTNGNGDDYYIDNLTFGAPAPVPEPSIIALFAAGLFGIGFVRRRQS